MLLKQQDIEDTLKLLELNLMISAVTIDRTQQSEITKFNEMFRDYRELLFSEVTGKTKNQVKDTKSLEAQMKTFQKTFRKKELQIKFGNKMTEEFKQMDLKDLYKLTQKEG